ncbi:Cytoplasmic tRNA 2-thiolation protein 1 [Dirofilaria immitis]|nr:Cytoplasmic tRNA 2-thiolation protein 1 [Dirofilaria immitis]
MRIAVCNSNSLTDYILSEYAMARCWQCDASASVKRSKDGKPACVMCFTDAFETILILWSSRIEYAEECEENDNAGWKNNVINEELINKIPLLWDLHYVSVDGLVSLLMYKAFCNSDAFSHVEVHDVIKACGLFGKGKKVAIGASGGKDSTVLIHVLNKLNQKHGYGLDIILLSIDEGITITESPRYKRFLLVLKVKNVGEILGYRDDSLKTVEKNRNDYGLPLIIMNYKQLYGWTMDEIVSAIGAKNNCTFVVGAVECGANIVATGHNADDVAETVLLNILRGDLARLQRCTDIVIELEGCLPRTKPLKYIFEKDIVMYAHFNRLNYFSTECRYAPDSFRNYVRCSCMSSQKLCKACLLLQGLFMNDHSLGVKKAASKQLSLYRYSISYLAYTVT